jgi:hypothetical protein
MQAAHRAQGAQQALAGETAADSAALARFEAVLEQLVRRIDSMGAVLGDVAEGTRTITALLQRETIPQDGPKSEVENPDPEDPGSPELPDRDEAPDG